MNTNAIIAIAAVVILTGAGAGVYIALKDGNDAGAKEIEPRDVTIKDSLGNEVTVTAPITRICTVNTSAAEFFKILGVEKRIVGMDTSGKATFGDLYKDATDIGNYKTPSGEKIAETGCKYVISQSTSRSLSADTEQALKDNYGIIVLRMDFYGETMMQDVEELLKILIDDDANNAFQEYRGLYDSIVSTTLEKSRNVAGDPSFLFMFTSMSSTKGTYYNDSSELAKIVKSIHGHNALVDMNITSKAGSVSATPSAETIYDYDQESVNRLGYVFLRGTATTTAEQDFQTFFNSGGGLNFQTELNVVKNGHLYVINTDLLSGPRDYIGRICICEAYGISTGLDIAKLTSDFNEKYGFTVEYGYLMKQYTAA